jgi:hypothetical protein
LRCNQCETESIAYNSCRNRHCPKCQASTAERWLERQRQDLLPIPYVHVVFTLPAELRAIAYQNKGIVYDLMFKCVADTLLTIAADPKRLGAKIGITALLHTGGSSLVHHPHIHCIVTGGGLDQDRWIPCRPNFFLPVKVLGARFRNRFLKALGVAHRNRVLKFFDEQKIFKDPGSFDEHLRPLEKIDWIVYAKRPLRRTRGRADLPLPLHPPHRDLQSQALSLR